MSKQTLFFLDSICIPQPGNKIAKDLSTKLLDSDRQPVLKVLIDATHSGVLTNLRVYPGKKVQSGYTSYFGKDKGGTAEFDKPVLKHHDHYGDPVGRIVGAKFTQIKSGQDFELDYLSPDTNGGKGSGFVTVEALINDQDTIKKILDGRFISVSSGHHTDLAMCSVCGESIMRCDHMPGSRYNEDGERTSKVDAQLCYIITNNLIYDELSFVNIPAQPPAKLINFNWSDCKELRDKDSILVESMSHGTKETVRSLILSDAEDEINLLTGQKKSDSKKTTIAVKTAVADKLKAALSLPNAESDDANVRELNSKEGEEQPEQNLMAKETQSNEDKEMNLEELQKKIEGLETKLRDAEQLLKDATEKVKAQEGTIKGLTEEAKNLDSKVRKSLATTLASLKVRLKKPDALEVDNDEKLTALVDKLAARSLSSLEDAVSDLLIELKNVKETDKTVADLTSKDKLTDPNLSRGAKPENNTDQSKQKTAKSGADKLDAALDL